MALIRWLKYNDIFPLVVFLVYVLSIVFVPLAFAGGGDDYFEQQIQRVDRPYAQKSIEITVVEPESDWTDHLAWAIPGVIIPVAGWYLNKKRKND